MSDDRGKSVTVIGLGLMGSALADALLAKGIDLTVWNRSPDRAARFAGKAVRVAASVFDAVQSSDVIVVCLLDHAATRAVLMTDEIGKSLRGKTLVEMTSTTAEEMSSLASWSEANGVALLHGCILVYPDDIRAGEGTVIYGGSRSVFDAIQLIVGAMGGEAALVTCEPQAVSNVASAHWCVMYPALVGFLHGAAVCRSAGVSIEVFAEQVVLPALRSTTLAGMFGQLGKAAAARSYNDNVQAALDTWNDGLGIVIGNVESAGVKADLLHAAKAELDFAADRGFGQQDLASVIETLVVDQ